MPPADAAAASVAALDENKELQVVQVNPRRQRCFGERGCEVNVSAQTYYAGWCGNDFIIFKKIFFRHSWGVRCGGVIFAGEHLRCSGENCAPVKIHPICSEANKLEKANLQIASRSF